MTAGGLGRAAVMAVAAAALVAGAATARSAFAVTAVDGPSMRPALEPADVLIIERKVRSVSPGDIIVFPRAGWSGGVAHRVVAVLTRDRLRTRGDANPTPDREPVAAGSIIGRVIAFLPTGRVARLLAGTVRRALPMGAARGPGAAD